ncbi:hypothetical protein F441_06052 [Phytophthora nicotianae CJ01A1]|uniref:Uncharacterized protein n=4 Tax=Phytophthora nicotianae TaxID=4792 RepID=V9FJ61_PHYNI|nr:hypothetical protein F443_06038 [Phytophthora nicotianae P1569]ETK90295.1 hypothetical protein L915_05918 [Phytophthora nicotianae]ETO79152.1 hypothetical protein F444_06093 [Phytophthora nicotianae P1976]ETP20180.1 hypothetical protein F441_06052 [Phytophthora nicotianae CJ01A1]
MHGYECVVTQTLGDHLVHDFLGFTIMQSCQFAFMKEMRELCPVHTVTELTATSSVVHIPRIEFRETRQQQFLKVFTFVWVLYNILGVYATPVVQECSLHLHVGQELS